MVLIYNFFANLLKVATIYKYQYSPISIKKHKHDGKKSITASIGCDPTKDVSSPQGQQKRYVETQAYRNHKTQD